MGSMILTFAVAVLILVRKINAKTLDTKLKDRTFTSLALFAAVTGSILIAVGFGGHGQINPAVTLMFSVFEEQFESLWFIIGFQLIGASIAAGAFMLVANLWGKKDILKDTFKFQESKPSKNLGMEAIANTFWLLPIMALYIALKGSAIDVFELALAASISLVFVASTLEEIGAPNLNPQVWFGMYIIKLFVHKGKISGKQLLSEWSSVLSVLVVAAAIGGIGYGIEYSKIIEPSM